MASLGPDFHRLYKEIRIIVHVEWREARGRKPKGGREGREQPAVVWNFKSGTRRKACPESEPFCPRRTSRVSGGVFARTDLQRDEVSNYYIMRLTFVFHQLRRRAALGNSKISVYFCKCFPVQLHRNCSFQTGKDLKWSRHSCSKIFLLTLISFCRFYQRSTFPLWKFKDIPIRWKLFCFRPLLKQIKNSAESHIVLDCSTERIYDVLKQAQQIGMMSDYHSYLITSLVGTQD